MKRVLFLPAFLAGLFVLSTVLYAENGDKKADGAMEKKCVEITKDTWLMDKVMDRIAADESLRMGMMGKLLVNAGTRKDRMREMSGVMMGDNGMKGATMDDIASDDSLRQEMMEKIMKHAKGHEDEIKATGQMMRDDQKHSLQDDKNAEGMQGEGKNAPVRMMNDKDDEKDSAGK
jgi:hypothetical protein